MHVFGQILAHLLHSFVHGIGNVDVVGSRLWHHCHSHHGHPVHLHVALDVARCEFSAADVAEADDAAVLLLDDKVVELLGGVHLSHGADGKLCGVTFDGA